MKRNKNTSKWLERARHFVSSTEILWYLGFVLLSGGIWLAHAYFSGTHRVPTDESKLSEEEIAFSQQTTEKVLQIPIEKHGVPKGYVLNVFPESIEVVVRVQLRHYQDIQSYDLQASVSYPSSKTDALSVFVKCRKPYAEVIHIQPQTVEYLIEEK